MTPDDFGATILIGLGLISILATFYAFTLIPVLRETQDSLKETQDRLEEANEDERERLRIESEKRLRLETEKRKIALEIENLVKERNSNENKLHKTRKLFRD